MHTLKLASPLAALLLAAGCGGGGDGRDPEDAEAPMNAEETVVGDLVTAPGRVEERTNSAVDTHREALESRLRADEGAAPDATPPEE